MSGAVLRGVGVGLGRDIGTYVLLLLCQGSAAARTEMRWL